MINVVHFAISEGCVPDPNIFLRIAKSVADAVKPNSTKTFLANGLSTFPN